MNLQQGFNLFFVKRKVKKLITNVKKVDGKVDIVFNVNLNADVLHLDFVVIGLEHLELGDIGCDIPLNKVKGSFSISCKEIISQFLEEKSHGTTDDINST